MMPDKLCLQFAVSGEKITILEKDDFVLIEGTKESLMFLSKLIAAQSKANDVGFHLSPFGAGCQLFSKKSTKGIYIHRIKKHRKE